MIEQHYQQLIHQDGVHKDLLRNQQKFEKCQICNCIFTKNFYPLLLSCGHFICKICTPINQTDAETQKPSGLLQFIFKSNIQTKCYLCSEDSGKNVNVKNIQYRRFVEFKSVPSLKKEKEYLFRVTFLNESKTGKICHATLDMTPQQIINKYEYAREYMDKIKLDMHKYFQINGKPIYYPTNKNIALKNMKSQSGVPVLIHSGETVNAFILQDRSLGGCQ